MSYILKTFALEMNFQQIDELHPICPSQEQSKSTSIDR